MPQKVFYFITHCLKGLQCNAVIVLFIELVCFFALDINDKIRRVICCVYKERVFQTDKGVDFLMIYRC